MFSSTATFVIFAALATKVLGHGTISAVTANGKTYPNNNADQNPSPVWHYGGPDPFGPIKPEGYTDNNLIACNNGGKVGAQQVEVAAGGTVDIKWMTGENGASPWAHQKGPIIDYLAQAPEDFSQASADNLKFFKVAEAGLESGGDWAMNTKLHATNLWTVTVPANVKAGNYVLRHEPIALHGAQAENYPICVNLKVTGGGSEAPTGVLGSQLYTPTQVGLTTNVYGMTGPYEMPGPAMPEAFKNSGAPAPAPGAGSPSPSPSAVPNVPSPVAPPTVPGTPAPGAGAGAAPVEIVTVYVTVTAGQAAVPTAAAPASGSVPVARSVPRRHARGFRS